MERERLEELVSAYLDGALTPQEAAELVEGLRRDPEARRYLLRAAGTDVALHELASSSRAARPRTRRPFARPAWRAAPALVAASAAAAVLIAIAFYAASSRPAPAPERVAGPVLPEPPKTARPPASAPPADKPPSAPDVPAEVPPKPGPKAPLPPPPPKPEPPPPPKPAPPQPEPAPPPEKPAPPPLKETVVAIAQVRKVLGQVFLVTGTDRAPVRAGQDILPKQKLETAGADAFADVVTPDATRYELGADASAVFEAPGRVFLAEGELAVDLSAPPKDRAVTVTTPHAEARALGTRFTVARRPEATHLEVEAGAVRFTRLPDNASIDVRDGFQAVAAKGVMLTSRRFLGPNLLADPGFEKGDPAWAKNDEAIASVKSPAHSGGRALQLPLTFPKDLAVSQKFMIAAGAAVHATAWVRVGVKAGKGAVRALLVWRDAKGAALRTDVAGRVAEAQDWTRLGGRFAAPPGATQAQLFFMAEGDPAGSGAAWVDDVSVRRRQ